MLIKTTNHYLTAADIANVLAMDGRKYIELDGIRLVCDDHRIVGWYNPGCACPALNCTEPGGTAPSEV